MSRRLSLADLVAHLPTPRSWRISLEGYRRGIDNSRVDCLISPRFQERTAEIIESLVREDFAALGRRLPEQQVSTDDLAVFRSAYLGLFEAALERSPGRESRDSLTLLQLALLRLLIELCERASRSVIEGLRDGSREAAQPGDGPWRDERLVQATRAVDGVRRRVLSLILRQVRAVESGHLIHLRSSVLGQHWPIEPVVLFNPILTIPDPAAERALVADYPIAGLGELIGPDWLARVDAVLTDTLGARHDGIATGDAEPSGVAAETAVPADARPPGSETLSGLSGLRSLLGRFVPRDEYRRGLMTWLDEPENLLLLLDPHGGVLPPSAVRAPGAPLLDPDWCPLRADLQDRVCAALEDQGLLVLARVAYALPVVRAQLGQGIPASLVLEHAQGQLGRRRLAQRLAALRCHLDPAAVERALVRGLEPEQRRGSESPESLAMQVTCDFYTLRRDLKLAYKTLHLLEGIRLIEGREEIRLSRANGTLYEYPLVGERGPAPRRVHAHAVVKADVRGSTLIAEELRARGLNPASHFSLNLFGPVNRLLPEFAADKLFVEGDAVILALYEYLDPGPRLAVVQACRLSRKILQVVAAQNQENRHHDLPELELGLGVSYSPREPNFLYDEGRRIMISSAINQADRLSACSGLLRRSGFAPAHAGFRVAVVRDAVGGERAGPGRDLLTYNVNGVKLDESAFIKLQEEIPMTQVRLPGREAPESLFFFGSFADADGRHHPLVVRHAPVLDWYGDALGPVEPQRRHYFELIVEQELTSRVRRLAAPAEH